MRVRKFTNRGSTTKVIGKFPSLKMGRTVWWESQLERDMIYLLEFDSDVISYREQPLRLTYYLNRERHMYTPDFLVEHRDMRQIVEVKYEKDAVKPDNVLLFRCVASVCRETGYNFIVATDREIRLQPRLDNIKLLWRYSRTPVDPQHLIYCCELARKDEHVHLADAFAYFEERGATRATVYALIYQGALEVDLMQPLGPAALVSSPASLPIAGRKVS